MNLCDLIIGLSCIMLGSTFGKEVAPVKWQVKIENVTVFMANMAVQWSVTYDLKNGSRVQKTMTFTDPKAAKATAESDSLLSVRISDKSLSNLTMHFVSEDDSYFLQNASVQFVVNNLTFPDAKASNSSLTLQSDDAKYFSTKSNMSYTCTMESQLSLNSDVESFKNGFVRLVGPKDGLQLQAFDFTEEGKFGNASSCSWDTRDTLLEKISLKLEVNQTVCAIIETILGLNIYYHTVNGKNMSTMIPVKSEIAPSGSCGDQKNITTMTIHLDNDVGNLTLGFEVLPESFSIDGVDLAVMNALALEYDPTSVYFPNHAKKEKVTIRNTSLSEFKTAYGSSYQCLALSSIMITDAMSANFNRTKVQAFGLKNSTFGKVDGDCQEIRTTTVPQTTVSPTTLPLPMPVDPIISNRTIKDDKNESVICLHGEFGLQLWFTYRNDKSKQNTDYSVSFNSGNETTTLATCNQSLAVINFTVAHTKLQLKFIKSNSMSELTEITVTYDPEKLPNHSSEGSGSKSVSAKVTKFKTPSNMSYQCSEGTDIFVSNDGGDVIVLRTIGIILEAFPAKEQYAPASKCFQDLVPLKATSGHYLINSTDSSNRSFVCAAFTLTVDATVKYRQLVDEDPRTTYIPIDGQSYRQLNNSFGTCDGKDNITTLIIPSDDRSVNFSFTFKKENISGNDFEYAMTKAEIIFGMNSKYFPNHDYNNETIVLSSPSLSLFVGDQDHSYKCKKNVTARVTNGTIFIASVQVQPFGVDTPDGSFKSAKVCASDDLSPIIPIIVGSVLAGLVVVVLIAYIIGRKRNSSASYESI